MTLIDWVDCQGKLWGHARRRLDFNPEKYPPSISGRIADALPYSREQRYPEVFTGEVLRFNLAWRKLPERQLAVCYAHYVLHMTVAKKASLLHLSRARYFETLTIAHRKIANRLQYA